MQEVVVAMILSTDNANRCEIICREGFNYQETYEKNIA
jgi:hypothetical protein